MNYDGPQGFILSEAALYAFTCQDIFPDLLSFSAAIPEHLRSLFVIPIKIEQASAVIASRVANKRYGDGTMPTGDTEEAELFGTKTFVNYDNEPQITDTEPGSIFDIDGGWGQTKHQDTNIDQNIQVPTDTTFMEDVDTTQYQKYPYRTEEKPVRHSSVNVSPTLIVRIALHPGELVQKTPEKIRDNAGTCNVRFISYDKKSRIYTFAVNCGNKPHTVRAALSDVDHVSLNCDCKFWRWNGPEFNAKSNKYMIAPQHGTAAPPDVRDPDRVYSLCKHTYAVLRRFDDFVQEIVEENWDEDEDGLLKKMDKDWDRLEGVAEVPLEEIEEEDPLTNADWDEKPEVVEETPEEIEEDEMQKPIEEDDDIEVAEPEIEEDEEESEESDDEESDDYEPEEGRLQELNFEEAPPDFGEESEDDEEEPKEEEEPEE